MALPSTSPISARAKPNSTITESPSMRCDWRSTQPFPAMERIAVAAQAAPARISTRRKPSASGDSVRSAPKNVPATPAALVNGVAAVQAISNASETAPLSPINAASDGDEKVGGGTACNVSASRRPGAPRRSGNAATPNPKRAPSAISGSTSMVQATAAISRPGRAHCARSATGSIRRNAKISSRITVSEKYGRNSAPSGGAAMPTNIDAATARVPWRPSQPRPEATLSRSCMAGS